MDALEVFFRLQHTPYWAYTLAMKRRTNIYLVEQDYSLLAKIAAEKGISTSELLRRIIAWYVGQYGSRKKQV